MRSWSTTCITKIFPNLIPNYISCMNFDYCQQKKEKQQQNTKKIQLG